MASKTFRFPRADTTRLEIGSSDEDDVVDTPLLLEEDGDEKASDLDHTHASDRFPRDWRCRRSTKLWDVGIASGASTTLTILVALGLWYLSYQHNMSAPLRWEAAVDHRRPGTISCGDTREEALARGCTFDLLSMMYMPSKCTTAYSEVYLTADNDQPFAYWTDRHAQYRVDDPSLHAGNATLWTSRRNHLVHCQYYLYRLAHVLKTGEYLGQDYDDVSLSQHMQHCVMVLTEFALKSPADELDVTDIYSQVSFGYC